MGLVVSCRCIASACGKACLVAFPLPPLPSATHICPPADSARHCSLKSAGKYRGKQIRRLFPLRPVTSLASSPSPACPSLTLSPGFAFPPSLTPSPCNVNPYPSYSCSLFPPLRSCSISRLSIPTSPFTSCLSVPVPGSAGRAPYSSARVLHDSEYRKLRSKRKRINI